MSIITKIIIFLIKLVFDYILAFTNANSYSRNKTKYGLFAVVCAALAIMLDVYIVYNNCRKLF